MTTKKSARWVETPLNKLIALKGLPKGHSVIISYSEKGTYIDLYIEGKYHNFHTTKNINSQSLDNAKKTASNLYTKLLAADKAFRIST
jgi:hypothetical protein